jgi:hypothetical protein
MLKHVNMKPPISMAEKMVEKALSDHQNQANQAPIIPPIPMLASSQKIHIFNVFTSGRFIRLSLHSSMSLNDSVAAA